MISEQGTFCEILCLQAYYHSIIKKILQKVHNKFHDEMYTCLIVILYLKASVFFLSYALLLTQVCFIDWCIRLMNLEISLFCCLNIHFKESFKVSNLLLSGSGKTFAYLLPIVQNILQQKRKQILNESETNAPHSLIIVPTIELVNQIMVCIMIFYILVFYSALIY